MARTTRYINQIKNQIAYVNKKMREIENKFGIGSEQQQRYVNAITAALPPGSFNLKENGQIRIKGGNSAGRELTKGQLRPLVKLPTASHSMKSARQSIAKGKLQREGIAKPTAKEISEAAVDVSEQEALQELGAKAFLESMENAKGKLRYDESVRAEMSAKGAKSYDELRRIIERGEKNRAKREKKAEYQRKYRAEHREEVNRKQREYRARKRAEALQNS